MKTETVMIPFNKKNLELKEYELALNQFYPGTHFEIDDYSDIESLTSYIRLNATSEKGEWEGIVHYTFTKYDIQRIPKEVRLRKFARAAEELIYYGQHQAEIDAKRKKQAHLEEIKRAGLDYE
jgi:hypothetical protein